MPDIKVDERTSGLGAIVCIQRHFYSAQTIAFLSRFRRMCQYLPSNQDKNTGKQRQNS